MEVEEYRKSDGVSISVTVREALANFNIYSWNELSTSTQPDNIYIFLQLSEIIILKSKILQGFTPNKEQNKNVHFPCFLAPATTVNKTGNKYHEGDKEKQIFKYCGRYNCLHWESKIICRHIIKNNR